MAWGWGWRLASKSLSFCFFFNGLYSKSRPISSKPQVVFNLMTPGERKRNPPRPEQPRGGEQHRTPVTEAAPPRMDCFGRPGRPSSAATPPGLGAAPAVLLMTTRGQARLRISLGLQDWAARATTGCPQLSGEAWGHPRSPAQGPRGSSCPRRAWLLSPW